MATRTQVPEGYVDERPTFPGALDKKDLVRGRRIVVNHAHLRYPYQVVTEPFPGSDGTTFYIVVERWRGPRDRDRVKPEVLSLAEMGIEPYRDGPAPYWESASYTVAD